MSFVEQQDVFDAVEPVIRGVFEEFSEKAIDQEFVHIPFAESMLKYGNDKPDLRIPIEISDVTEIFRGSVFRSSPRRLRTAAWCAPFPGQMRQPGDRRQDEQLGAVRRRPRHGLYHLWRR